MSDSGGAVFGRETVGDAMVLAPKGQINTASAQELDGVLNEIFEQNPDKLVIDCSEVSIITSAGLRVLLMAGKKLTGKPGGLTLCGLSPAVKEVFDISGFTALFSIHNTRDEALAAA